MNRKRPIGNRSAFTLIEVILAVGVMAILLAAVNAVFFSALRLRERTCLTVDAALPTEQALTFLRHDLQCVMPPGGILAGDFRAGNVNESNRNETVSIELYTATASLHENEPWAEIQRITYELREPANPSPAGGKDLVRSVTRNLLNTVSPEVQDQWMLGGVQDLAFECFDGTQWLEAWDTTTTETNLPVAVRVSIRLAEESGEGSQAVQMVIPIAAGLAAAASQETSEGT
jgi:type II secretion system protein J